MHRRTFLSGALTSATLAACTRRLSALDKPLVDVVAHDRVRILVNAGRHLKESPRTLTSVHSPRSSGGPHDYFSEGDYWWPDPDNPNGPYIRRDGFSNPNNFNEHRELLIRLSLIVPALTAAWVLTHKSIYAQHAAAHLRAWFITPDTRMKPSLQYAQAIHGISPGRGTGIIDTLHLIEVARSAAWLEHSGALSADEQKQLRDWFTEYTTWMSTSKNGQDERDAKNNHGTCWVAQYAAFSQFIGNRENVAWCNERFRTTLIPGQVALDGRLPLELARTKPFSYSLFDMDVLAIIAQIASTSQGNLWTFQTSDGRGLQKVVSFLYPFIADKNKWPFPHDVEYWDDLPNRQPALIFAGIAYRNASYINLWKRLPVDPSVPEMIRNFPIRQPLLWVREPA